MRRRLQFAALAVVALTTAWWGAAGARIGFWQTQVSATKTDAVTGIPYLEWHRQFVPGIETPVLGCLIALALVGASFLINRRKSN